MCKKLLSLLFCAILAISLILPAALAESDAADQEQALFSADTLFDQADLTQQADTGAGTSVILEGTSARIDGKEAAESGTLTLSQAGVYVLTGEFQGQIVVDAGKKDDVWLVLDGVGITSADSAAIYVKKAGKVTIFLADGSENTLENGGSYAQTDTDNIDSVIFSKADLLLKGSGSLSLQANAGHGMVSKDNLIITGGNYTIQADQHGIVGKDSLRIAGGSFCITSGGDGLHAKNADDASLGFLYIRDGEFTVFSADDGISATGNLQIDAGSFSITSGGGSENGQMKASDAAGMQWNRGGLGFSSQTETTDENNAKGIVSDGSVTVLSGSFQLDCADDAVHAAGDVTLNGGDWSIRTADDGIHSDANTVVSGGSFSIPYCYEGIEGQSVTIHGGTIDILSTDDGINAAGSSDSSNTWGRGFGGGDSSAFIVVNGGTITIVSDGDCLDSNGTLTLNGGTLNLTCNGYGNTAIDYESSYANNGAEVTTNDGSENGGGMMGGMKGGMMGGGRGQHPEGMESGGFGQRPEGMQPDGFGQPPEGREFGGSSGGRTPVDGNSSSTNLPMA